MGFKLEQVQDFTPTPMTVATVIYYTGVHPYNLKPVHTYAKSKNESGSNTFSFSGTKRENHNDIRENWKASDGRPHREADRRKEEAS